MRRSKIPVTQTFYSTIHSVARPETPGTVEEEVIIHEKTDLESWMASKHYRTVDREQGEPILDPVSSPYSFQDAKDTYDKDSLDLDKLYEEVMKVCSSSTHVTIRSIDLEDDVSSILAEEKSRPGTSANASLSDSLWAIIAAGSKMKSSSKFMTIPNCRRNPARLRVGSTKKNIENTTFLLNNPSLDSLMSRELVTYEPLNDIDEAIEKEDGDFKTSRNELSPEEQFKCMEALAAQNNISIDGSLYSLLKSESLKCENSLYLAKSQSQEIQVGDDDFDDYDGADSTTLFGCDSYEVLRNDKRIRNKSKMSGDMFRETYNMTPLTMTTLMVLAADHKNHPDIDYFNDRVITRRAVSSNKNKGRRKLRRNIYG